MPTAASHSEAVTDSAHRATMRAAVYTGNAKVEVQDIAMPELGPGEILIRVESCGICHTDLKKIEHDLLAPPRVYGHETAGVVSAVGSRVTKYQRGDRVIVFHHIPCKKCFYCERKLYAQCDVYKKVGVTAGFEPAGGGFSQYVRVMDWIVEAGVEKIPDGVSFDQACFVEPVNTCVKAFHEIKPQPGEVLCVLGQGPIGLIFTMLGKRSGLSMYTTDPFVSRRKMSRHFGAVDSFDPVAQDADLEAAVRKATSGRGADIVIVAASAPGIAAQAVRCSRPGSRIMLFAQTSDTERIEISGAAICKDERQLLGVYSASVDLQKESADLVFSGELPVSELISHRYPLDRICEGIERALHPDEESLKIVVQPQI